MSDSAVVIDAPALRALLRATNPQADDLVLDSVAHAMAATGRAVVAGRQALAGPVREPAAGDAAREGAVEGSSINAALACVADGDLFERESTQRHRIHFTDSTVQAPGVEEMSLSRIRELALLVDPEEWAGDVLGPKAAAARLRIARSTLDNWRTAGLIVVIPKGRTGHVVPMAQFQARRPLAGLDRVLKAAQAGSRPRPAVVWCWLTLPQARLAGQPIEALRAGRVKAVAAAAARFFGGPAW